MPRLRALVERGAPGDLENLVPSRKSPTIRATIGTGERPAKRGITNFILGRRHAVLRLWITLPATPRVVRPGGFGVFIV